MVNNSPCIYEKCFPERQQRYRLTLLRVTALSVLIRLLALCQLNFKDCHFVVCTSLRAGFQVYLSKLWVLICHQSSTIPFVVVFSKTEKLLFPGFVGQDGCAECGRCLAGGRGCLLKGPHLIPSLSELSPILRLPHFDMPTNWLVFDCCKAGTLVLQVCKPDHFNFWKAQA